MTKIEIFDPALCCSTGVCGTEVDQALVTFAADFDWAKDVVAEHRLHEVCDVLFSPSYTQLAPRTLAGWIVDEKLPVRFQMQLHKLLWGNMKGK